MLAIGLMSGTSLDGVDACLVEIKMKKFQIVKFCYTPYKKEFKKKLLNIVENNPVTIQEICSLNVELGKLYLKACEKLIKQASVRKEDIEFIAMHGQTLWHNPNNKDGYESSTLQLGDASVLAAGFGCKVVSNFRAIDMAYGGSGAPLVPFANYILFSDKKKSIALQNIGGIGNVTYLKRNGTVDDIIAFDTGPGNMLIDQAMRRLYNKEYDLDGSTAKSGKIIMPVLSELMNDEYLYLVPPKSTGREKYNNEFLSEIILKIKSYGGTDADIITTLAAYTADTISMAYKTFLPDIDKVIVSGGGAFNQYIINRLKEKLPCKVEINADSDCLEALSFVILGFYTLNHEPSNVPNVTGAKCKAVLGEVTNPVIGGK